MSAAVEQAEALASVPATAKSDVELVSEKWGLPLRELFRQSLSFYKDKSGKAIHLTYEDNVKLVAFTQQASQGPLDSTKVPPLGVLDVIGRDRRVAWQNLGPLTKAEAMEGFIDTLDRLCPLLRTYVEAYKKSEEDKARRALEEERRAKEVQESEAQRVAEQKKADDARSRDEMQRRLLQDALNQQTYHQFKMYAEKQFPGAPEQQAVLIRQLQNEHYHQYMQQLHAHGAGPGEMRNGTSEAAGGASGHQSTGNDASSTVDENGDETRADNQTDDQGNDSDSESGEYQAICPANMWTRSDIDAFKQEVTNGKGDGVLKVGHGDTVTVRVPTYEGGSCLFWEFATDNYDIGFGVFFEWGKPTNPEVLVHVSESDEDEDALDDDDGELTTEDLEAGASQTPVPSSIGRNRPPVSIIVPVYRRECHNEVYAGSHAYPGEGVYLLKFDNSHSVWRSKTLYYRVFYTGKV